MKSTVCVLFNHAFPKNIPVLRKIYKGRFDNVVFIQPLASSPNKDVITSYRGSYCFHGMIVDAARRLLKNPAADYYLFIHDDVLLNPRYDAEQLFTSLGIPEGGAFIPYINPLGGDVNHWSWISSFLWKLFYPMNKFSGSGIQNLLQFFPDNKQTRKELEEKYKFKFSNITYNRDITIHNSGVFGNNPYSDPTEQMILNGLFEKAYNSQIVSLPFPFFHGVSDFFVVDATTLEKMIPILGVMAAAQIFVEIAIPTALIITAQRVKRASEVGFKIDYRWGEDRKLLDFEEIKNRFNEDLLFIHPVKLSKYQEQVLNTIGLLRSSK